MYAVEIQDEMIRFLANKKSLLKDSVVEIVKGSNISPNLPANSIDLAIMVDVYHELEFPRPEYDCLGRGWACGVGILAAAAGAPTGGVARRTGHQPGRRDGGSLCRTCIMGSRTL